MDRSCTTTVRLSTTGRCRDAVRRAAVAALLIVLTGCDVLSPQGRSVGELRPVSLAGEAVALPGTFNTAIYTEQLTSERSFYVSDRTVDELISGDFQTGQLIRIELLWNPHPGKTPLDPSATNVSIRYLVFANGELGVYEGGGFAIAKQSLLSDRMNVALLDAALRLSEATDGFHDLLGPTQLTGKFTATLDPAAAQRLHVTLSQRVTDALGETTLVQRMPDDARRIAASK